MKIGKWDLTVMTSSQEGFLVDSALVAGQRDAILFDAQFTLSDAHRVAATVLETGKHLAAIYITHFHPDHYFGLTALKDAFPLANVVALPSVVAQIKKNRREDAKKWKQSYGNNLSSDPIVPRPLPGRTLTLEGETFRIYGEAQGDARDNSYVWMPALKAVVCGDIVYSGVHLWTLETTPAERKEWIRSVGAIASLDPSIVVAGHKNPALKDDPLSLEFTRSYLTFYDEALAGSETAEEFLSKMKGRFPDLGLEVVLQMAADAAFPRGGRKAAA
jgi:glyoxylase-like metal-dependent hydrolase (beta-lactamase superfamily II)